VTISREFRQAMPRDTARPGGSAPAEALPAWDLSDLYASPTDPKLGADLDKAEAEARAFEAAHAGKVATLSGDALAAAIAAYEAIEERLGRAMSYAQLVFSGDAQDAANGRFYQTTQERVTAISSHLLFLTLEINRLEDEAMERKLAAPPRCAAGAPSSATCASSAHTSCPTSWKSCCMRRRSPAAPPGTACSMRRWRGCGFRSAGNS
jgi:hypothetical protein